MGRHVNATDIPVTVIAAATQGKPEAISYVLKYIIILFKTHL